MHDVHDGIKVLGNVGISSLLLSFARITVFQGAEYLKSPIFMTPSRASKSAIEAIEKKGGKIVCVYHNPLALRDCVKGRDDRLSAAPTRRQDISKSFVSRCMRSLTCLVWYSQHHNRGYLSPKTLKSAGNVPFVQERWKLLAEQLGAWQKQEFVVPKK